MLKTAAAANNNVEKMNCPDIKLQMPVINIRPIIMSLLKLFINNLVKYFKNSIPACLANDVLNVSAKLSIL